REYSTLASSHRDGRATLYRDYISSRGLHGKNRDSTGQSRSELGLDEGRSAEPQKYVFRLERWTRASFSPAQQPQMQREPRYRKSVREVKESCAGRCCHHT